MLINHSIAAFSPNEFLPEDGDTMSDSSINDLDKMISFY